MATNWSFYCPFDRKTVQAVIIPEMTGPATFAVHEKLKARIELGTVTADDIKAALQDALREHGLYAASVAVRSD